jgi:hypothetical protein
MAALHAHEEINDAHVAKTLAVDVMRSSSYRLSRNIFLAIFLIESMQRPTRFGARVSGKSD